MTTELEVSHEAGYAVIKAGYVKEAVSHEAGYAVIKAGYVKEAVSHVVAYAVIRAASATVPGWMEQWPAPLRGADLPADRAFQFAPVVSGAGEEPILASWATPLHEAEGVARTSPELWGYQLPQPPADPAATPADISWQTALEAVRVQTRSAAATVFQMEHPLQAPPPPPAAVGEDLGWLTDLSRAPWRSEMSGLDISASGFGLVIPALPVEPGIQWHTQLSSLPSPAAMMRAWIATTRDLQVSPPPPFRKPFVRGYVLT